MTRWLASPILNSIQRQRASFPITEMAKEPSLIDKLVGLLGELSPQTLNLEPVTRSRKAGEVRQILSSIEDAAKAALGRMDPVRTPENVFDPSSPEVSAWTVVLALLAQPRIKLAEVAPEYGAGVYALYYTGHHPLYRAISNTETPLYVGKADPAKGATRDIRTHGATLTGRLSDHRRQIAMVEKHAASHLDEMTQEGLVPLRLADFEARKLVCTMGIQLTAEGRLIHLFRPLWNSDFDVAHGISKHGDRQRKHPKSPWDVLHPGRDWADGLREDGTPFPDQLDIDGVSSRIAAHMPTMTIFSSREDVIRAVLRSFTQTPATADPSLAEALESQVEQSGVPT